MENTIIETRKVANTYYNFVSGAKCSLCVFEHKDTVFCSALHCNNGHYESKLKTKNGRTNRTNSIDSKRSSR